MFVAALISLPLPTVVALPGHAAATGLLLALSHDYIVTRSDRGVLYMSVVNLGLPFPDYFATLMREKIGSMAVWKVQGDEAVAMGIVESAHGGSEKVVEEGVKIAQRLASRKWKCEIYAEIRMSTFPEIYELLGITQSEKNKKKVEKL